MSWGDRRRAIVFLYFLHALVSSSLAQSSPPPALTWITNSSVKLEQIIGDVDWATGSNTFSQTISRFNIEGTDVGSPFENGTNLIILFGDTIGTNVDFHAADCFAWSTNTDGESGLLLNFFTESGTNLFVQPNGIKMGPDDVPNAGITISNVIYLVCSTGATNTGNGLSHSNSYSLLVTFDPATSTFMTNRTISYAGRGGRFVSTSLHQNGTNVVIFGQGDYRNSDIFLSTVPLASFLTGGGTLYFTGLTDGQPTWSTNEIDSVPVVQDNPTNGPAWPNDSPSVGDISAVYSQGLAVWLMTFDGGRHTPGTNEYQGVYFCCATTPWGPWSRPQLIFNAKRDNALGNFIYKRNSPTNPVPVTIDPANNNPTNTDGGVYAPHLIERFTRITNSTLLIYYTLSTWNPYTVVKMRSACTIQPVIDPASIDHKRNKFSFAWTAPTNESYQVDYSSNLASGWTTFTDVVSSTSGTFYFTNNQPGGLPQARFYRVREWR
jgi:hypothetical protein